MEKQNLVTKTEVHLTEQSGCFLLSWLISSLSGLEILYIYRVSHL